MRNTSVSGKVGGGGELNSGKRIDIILIRVTKSKLKSYKMGLLNRIEEESTVLLEMVK